MAARRITLHGCSMVLLLSITGFAAADRVDLRLVEAVQKRDKAAVRSLLTQHPDVNARQSDGATALHWAAHWDDLETADLLIRAGAKAGAANDYGVTPLSLACTNGSAAMVEKLLNAGANPNAALPSGETALMTCSRTGNVDAVRALVARGADVNARESEQGQTALMWAAAQKHPGVAKLLIEHRADFRARSKTGFTPLLFAARVGDIDTAKVLLESGADVNEATPAAAPAKPAAPKTVPDNSKNGGAATPPAAEPQAGGIAGYSFPASDRAPGGMSALLMATASGREALAIFLLEKGADPNAADSFGATALHYAMEKGIAAINGISFANYVAHVFRPSMSELVKALLEHGANPNVRLVKSPPLGGRGGAGAVGATPYLLAAASGDASLMRLLASHGADPLVATKRKLTPLMAASGVSRGQDFTEEEKKTGLEAAKVAVELGSDVNAANEDGLTALHGASVNGANGIIQFLAEHGAKLDAKDKYQQTPLSIASGIRLPWIPKGEELGEIIQKSTEELLLKLGATPLSTPGYFTRMGEDTEVYRMNPKSETVPGLTTSQ